MYLGNSFCVFQLENTYLDKQKVNLLESSGLLSKGKRVLIYTKKYPSPTQVLTFTVVVSYLKCGFYIRDMQ